MERAVLTQILERLDGVEKAAGGYEMAEDLRVTMFVGPPGDGMSITQIESCQLLDAILEVHSRESGTVFFIAYEDLHAVSCRRPKTPTGRRTGFA